MNRTVIFCQYVVGIFFIASVMASYGTDSNRVKRDDANDSVPSEGRTVFKVATIVTEPYTYYDAKESGNARYYGYIPDLLSKLKQRLDFFDYELRNSSDNRYGTKVDGKWTGMIGDLLKKKKDPSDVEGVDIAAAPITITKAREQVVDFIQPFAHIGLSAVIQNPNMNTSDAPDPKPWHFNFDVFKPLSAEVWILVTVIMVVVWLFFWLMNCFNPYEYGERYKRNLASEDQANLFTFTGSLWFTFTTLQWQGYDRAPRSVASKMMGCFWMVFITLTIVTYISSFVNHMFWASSLHRNQHTATPVRDLVDLVEHKHNYTYGTVKGGSTYAYITQVAPADEFKRMTKYWETNRGQKDLVTSTKEGIEKTRFSRYAFIGETMTIRHAVSSAEQCDLMELGIMFGMRSYGLAINTDFPHKEELDQAILHMIETGDIDALEEKWFNDRKCHQVREKAEADADMSVLYLNQPQRVTLHMFWSPLVLISIGIVVSVGVGIGEILWYKYRGRYDANNRQRGHQLTNEDDGHI